MRPQSLSNVIRISAFCVFLLLLSACGGGSSSSEPANPNTATQASNSSSLNIAGLLEQEITNQSFNGSVLIAQSGEIILNKGYGNANRESNSPNDSDTIFRIASRELATAIERLLWKNLTPLTPLV